MLGLLSIAAAWAKEAPAPLCQFLALDVGTLLAIAAGWEVVYQLAKRVTSGNPHEKVAKLGASYLIACVNATVCSVGGCWAVLSLLTAEHHDRLVVTGAESPYWPGGSTGEMVERLAYSFLGWLIFDIVHLVLWFPKLGAADMLAHHIGFFCLTCLGVSYRVMPFPVAWLLLGEISSLPLNLRWYLISTGRGASKLMNCNNVVFALSFFVVRVLIYWAGVYHMLVHMRPALLAPPYSCPALVVNTICFFITAGACLNGH